MWRWSGDSTGENPFSLRFDSVQFHLGVGDCPGVACDVGPSNQALVAVLIGCEHRVQDSGVGVEYGGDEGPHCSGGCEFQVVGNPAALRDVLLKIVVRPLVFHSDSLSEGIES